MTPNNRQLPANIIVSSIFIVLCAPPPPIPSPSLFSLAQRDANLDVHQIHLGAVFKWPEAYCVVRNTNLFCAIYHR